MAKQNQTNGRRKQHLIFRFLKSIVPTCRLLTVPLLLGLFCSSAVADTGLPALSITDNSDGSQTVSMTLQVLAFMTALTFLPAIVTMMTCFTRVIVVLAILRQAIGLQQTPSNQILIGLALFLSFFIMTPTLSEINTVAIQPYLAETLPPLKALEEAKVPMREFMLAQTRLTDLKTFSDIAGLEPVDDFQDIPFSVLVPAFVTSELKTAFQIGFLLFLPFLVLDMVIASILMSMGMMMLSPLIISLPFKIMLFVMVDGWNLVLGSLANSFS